MTTKKSNVREWDSGSHMLFRAASESRSHFDVLHDAPCRFKVSMVFETACSCDSFAKSHGVGGAVRTSTVAGQPIVRSRTQRCVPLLITAGSVDPGSSKSRGVCFTSTAPVRLVWSSPEVDVDVDAPWEALTLQARNPEYMAVTDVSVSDDGTRNTENYVAVTDVGTSDDGTESHSVQ